MKQNTYAPLLDIESSILPMRDCPRFPKCSAPICPLDPDWKLRGHRVDERVCAWLTELAKSGGDTRVTAQLGAETASRIAELSPAIGDKWPSIQRAIERAASSGSRLVRGSRLGQTRRQAVDERN